MIPLRAIVAAQLLLLGGCAAAPDECDALCDVAPSAYEACMEQWGVQYGDPNTAYESRDDYDNWCATFNEERRQLADTSEEEDAPENLQERCVEQRDTLAAGNCNEYYSVFAD